VWTSCLKKYETKQGYAGYALGKPGGRREDLIINHQLLFVDSATKKLQNGHTSDRVDQFVVRISTVLFLATWSCDFMAVANVRLATSVNPPSTGDFCEIT